MENNTTDEAKFVCNKCGKPSEGEQECPYHRELNADDLDYEPLVCTCCDECTQECLDDI